MYRGSTKQLTLIDVKFVEIRFLLIPLIIESPAIKIVFLGCATKKDVQQNYKHLLT